MPYIKVDREKCKGCMLCVNVCPKRQIIPDKKLNKRGIKPIIFSGQGCNGCAFCGIICPDSAIEVYK